MPRNWTQNYAGPISSPVSVLVDGSSQARVPADWIQLPGGPGSTVTLVDAMGQSVTLTATATVNTWTASVRSITSSSGGVILGTGTPPAQPVPATLGPVADLDARTLVPGNIGSNAWDSPTRFTVQPYEGADNSAMWINPDGFAPEGSVRRIRFVAPFTGTVIWEQDSVSQAPSVGPTGPASVRLLNDTGLTQIGAAVQFTPGASPAMVQGTNWPITAGLGYVLEYGVNLAGQAQASFLGGTCRLRPTIVDSHADFWLANFVALEPHDYLHGNMSVPGYDTDGFAPLMRPRQSELVEIRARVLGQIMVATWCDQADYVGSAGASFSVTWAGQGPILYPGVQGTVSYTPLATTGNTPQDVIIRSGEQVETGYTQRPEPRGTMISRVYFLTTALEVERPKARVRIAYVVDSKGQAGYLVNPAKESLAAQFRYRGWNVWALGTGGRALVQDFGSATLNAKTAALLAGPDPTVIAIGSKRNDGSGSAFASPTSLLATLAGGLDALHKSAPKALIMSWGVSKEGNASENGVASWDTFRNSDRAAFNANGADGTLRSTWGAYVPLDACATGAEVQANPLIGSDTVHPGKLAYARHAQSVESVIVPGVPHGFPMLSLAPLFWIEADGPTMGGTMSSVTATGTSPPAITLSGSAARALILMIKCVAGGALGTAVLAWSVNGGRDWFNITTAASQVLGDTGLTMTNAAGPYNVDNLWVTSSNVATAKDLTSNGNDAIYSGANYLAYQGINGRPSFTGNAHIAGLGGLASYTLGIVFQAADATLRAAFGAYATGNAPELYSTTNLYVNDGTHNANTGALDVTVPHSVFVSVDKTTPANCTVWVDGAKVYTGDVSAYALTHLTLGYDGVSGYSLGKYWSAAIALPYSCDPTDGHGPDPIRCATAYWARKYGLPGNW